MSSYTLQITSANLTGITFLASFTDNTIVTIPNTVTSIGDGTNPITLVNSTKKFILDISSVYGTFTIGANAFKNSLLQSITFPSTNDVQVGNNAFQNSGLTSITLQTNVTFGSGCCQDCTNLKTVTVQSITVSEYMFQGCDSLGQITIPNTVTTISQYAFYNTQIEGLTFTSGGSSLTISVSAFQNCLIQNIALPARTTSIGNNAFSGCNRLTNLTLPAFTGCTFGDGVFFGCLSLQSVFISTGITDTANNSNSTGTSTFNGCSQLTTAQFDNGIRYISSNTFQDCVNLTKLQFNSLQSATVTFGDACFQNCGFDYLYLPSCVTTFIGQSFNNCTKLVQVVFDATDININTTNTFNGCSALTDLIFGLGFQTMTVTGTLTAPTYTLYVYTQTQASYLQNNNQAYQGKVVVKPYYNRKFVNHKSIYDNEQDPGYVMYTLPSSGNKFNDCTFYFRQASSTTSVVVITASDDGVMSNCVKMFSTTADIEGKTIQKIYKANNVWYAQSTNGTAFLVDKITSDYVLQNNFICEQEYDTDGKILTLNGSNLSTCDIFDLGNLTKSGRVFINDITRVKLTSDNNKNINNITINIFSSGSSIFEIADIDCPNLTLKGDNCVLYLEDTVKDRSQNWSINAASIVIHTLWVDYTVFQGQKEGEGQATLTSVGCDGEDNLIKFVADSTINFQLIQNKNDLIISPDTTDINSVYYSSGWTM